ncbi:molybdenum ABC transporter ATP-binding protein [Methylomicrobium lacus]|uniref:molybdenum ABC transporter ATP-binding protein n=1 Tax=Methylomicrobium lacus TaxID=136992 RepID=UPI00045EA802|nr:molybdenum ABC transporter ATP-binding protein [Methylomicrobium lacus]
MTQAIAARFALDYGAFRLDVDLRLPGSGISVLFGPSGSGKTTLLRCIAGLERPAVGRLTINGKVWQDSERGLFLPTHQRALGYVFQQANLFPHLNVYKNVCFGLKRIGKTPAAAGLDHTIELLGIGHLLDRMPARLSGGERQRVAIARALVLQPDILLMDEPLAALDYQRKQEILPYLTRLHQALDIPVLYVTHARQEVAKLADHLVVLHEGRVQASGPLAETLSRIDLPQAEDKQAAMIWEGRIAAHESEYLLTRVDCAGIELSMPLVDGAIGSPVRLQIYASDVSITLEAPHATSILNVLPATIIGMADHLNGQTVLRLKAGALPLLAHITRKSRQLLNLQVGKSVYVQIKGTSLLN